MCAYFLWHPFSTSNCSLDTWVSLPKTSSSTFLCSASARTRSELLRKSRLMQGWASLAARDKRTHSRLALCDTLAPQETAGMVFHT